MEQRPQFYRSFHGGNNRRHITALAGMIDHAEDQHRYDGTDGTQGHKTEAVVCGMAVITDGGNAHTKRHDKGNCHWACGHTAGIEGYA